MSTMKSPCIGCVYFETCGSTTRTKPCNGKITKGDNNMFTEGGKQRIRQANKYPILKNYYDEMVGCFIFSERIYNESENLRKEVVKFLKNAVAYTTDGEVDNSQLWVLELIQGYDEEQPELMNDAWLYSIREVERWC